MLVFERHLQYVNHPEEVMASSGMYAFGDMLLELFIGILLLIPTIFLVAVIRKSEAIYTGYAKVALGFSLTSPVCLALLAVPAVNQSPMLLGEVCMFRLVNAPFVLIGLGVSRRFARFEQAKRLSGYALIIEATTLALIAGLIVALAAGQRSR